MSIFEEPSRQPLPKTADLEELRYRALKSVVGLIPAGGGLFEFVTSPLARRRDDWIEDLERRLRDCERRVEGFRIEDLAGNEQFVSAGLIATQAALKTHQKEKLEALRNAVLNVALGKELSADRQSLFLALVDRFTVFHLAVLRFWGDPQGHFRSRNLPVPTLPAGIKVLAVVTVTEAMPELDRRAESMSPDRTGSIFQFTDLILSDLVSANLIALDRAGETWASPRFNRPGSSEISPAVTHLGEDFLAFISEPAEIAS